MKYRQTDKQANTYKLTYLVIKYEYAGNRYSWNL